jgi:hypothetical protein
MDAPRWASQQSHDVSEVVIASIFCCIFSVSEGHIVLEREGGNAMSRLWPITTWLALTAFITDNCGPGVRDPQPGAGGPGGAGGAAGGAAGTV